MKIESSRKIFEKQFNIKFHKNPFGGSPVASCEQRGRQTDRPTEGQTDATKLIFAFRNFANTHNKNIKLRYIFYLLLLVTSQCIICCFSQFLMYGTQTHNTAYSSIFSSMLIIPSIE
jgi:hypothetical protein